MGRACLGRGAADRVKASLAVTEYRCRLSRRASAARFIGFSPQRCLGGSVKLDENRHARNLDSRDLLSSFLFLSPFLFPSFSSFTENPRERRWLADKYPEMRLILNGGSSGNENGRNPRDESQRS